MSNDTHIFEYQITIQQTLDFLIDQRFKRLVIRSSLSIEEFIQRRITVNNKSVDGDYQLQIGDTIQYVHYRSDEVEFRNLIHIIYEDESILAIEKPDCLSVTPNTSYYFNSVLNLLKDQSQNLELSPLHRLDIETSGVLLLSKRKKDRSVLQKMFELNEIQKWYKTAVYGKFPESIKEISGKMIRDQQSKIYSKFKLIQNSKETRSQIVKADEFEQFSVLSLQAITGFTNQLRCHLAAVGHSIIGDKKYFHDETVYLNWFETGKIDERMILDKQLLHCYRVNFFHPIENKEIELQSDLKHFEDKVELIKQHFTI